MITEMIMLVPIVLLEGLFYAIPDLPAMPVDIVNALSAIGVYITQGAGILKFVLGSSFINAYIGAVLVLINFDRAYDLLFWVLRKIPLINVKQ